MRLKGKTALVTAAGQGIGHAAVLALAAEGAQVWATDVNEKLLAVYEGVANVKALPLNVLDRAAIQAVVAGMPQIDVLFNCAGVVHNGNIEAATDDDLDFAFNLNVRAQFWAIQAALPRMLGNASPTGSKGWGSIINMASVCSSLKGLPNRCVYGTTKAAVIGL
ncbi:MAG: NAD(P)-dependent oxidoreductase, partial [Rhodoferax sp.]|nr:NAD(P)-dependent oxidoreductase [Rhodoferax sp.]